MLGVDVKMPRPRAKMVVGFIQMPVLGVEMVVGLVQMAGLGIKMLISCVKMLVQRTRTARSGTKIPADRPQYLPGMPNESRREDDRLWHPSKYCRPKDTTPPTTNQPSRANASQTHQKTFQAKRPASPVGILPIGPVKPNNRLNPLLKPIQAEVLIRRMDRVGV